MLGLVAIQFAGSALLSLLTGSIEIRLIGSIAVSLFAGFIGGSIAQRQLLVPAIALWLAGAVYLIYVLHGIASASAPTSILEIVQRAAPGLLIAVAALVAGILCGDFYSRRQTRSVAT